MRQLLLVSLLALISAVSIAAQDLNKARAAWRQVRAKVLAENGQRHLRLGSWARDAGLVPQATTEFLLAVEVSEGANPGALTVLGIMRSLDEAFWKQRRKQPSRALLSRFAKRAQKALAEDRAGRFKVAEFAHRKKLEKEALQGFRDLVGDVDEALEVDGKGRIVLDVGKVPAGVSAQILATAVTIDEQRYLRSADLPGLPEASTIHETSTPELRVRGTIEQERLADLHALGSALLPHLETVVGGRPVERVRVFVFATRAEYAVYLAANAMQRFGRAGGFADYAAQQAIVCAEDLDEVGLRGMFLHELTHLYDYQVSPTALPSWYGEAFAESVGGPGAFRWQGGKLVLGGEMSAPQREQLAAAIDAFTLRTLLDSDVGKLWAEDAARAQRFYLEAWGFLEYLRTGAGENTAARFAVWEAMCRGKAIGARPRQPGEAKRLLDATEARAMFDVMFGDQLTELERGFVAWARGED